MIDRGACDFVTDIAAPLPLELVCDLMGIPESETANVFAQTNVILGLGDPEYVKPGTSPVVAALTSGKALADLMLELAKHKQGRQADDLTSALLAAAPAFGWFLAGPSKTADIEQALVLGAHGPCAATVVLVPPPNEEGRAFSPRALRRGVD